MEPNREPLQLSALGTHGQANSPAAKACIQGLTKTLALELRKFGVTGNATAPGFIITAMTEQATARMEIGLEEYRKRPTTAIAERRVGVDADIANAVAFFVSAGSGLASGQVLPVAGGPEC